MNKISTRVAVALSIAVTTLLGLTGVASATAPADPTGGAAEQLQTSLTDWISTYGVPMVVATTACLPLRWGSGPAARVGRLGADPSSHGGHRPPGRPTGGVGVRDVEDDDESDRPWLGDSIAEAVELDELDEDEIFGWWDDDDDGYDEEGWEW